MQYAPQLPNRRRALAIPLAAALLGAGVATTTYALTDGDMASPPEIVVLESSAGDLQAQPTPLHGHVP